MDQGTDRDPTYDPTLAERAIRRLLAEYCYHVDDGDVVSLLDCFTADAEFVFNGRGRAGHERLSKFFAATGAPEMRGKHMLANTVIDIDGDGATATSDFVFFARGDGGFTAALAGRYRDELRCEDGRWRLARRLADTL